MNELAHRVYRLYLAHPEGARIEAEEPGKARALGQSWLARRVGVSDRAIRRQIAAGRFAPPVELLVQRLEEEARIRPRARRRRRTPRRSARP